MSDERRKARSLYKDTALQSWLDAVAQRAEVPAIVVADEAGLLVAAGVAGVEADEMAATAARRAQPGDQEVTVVDEQGGGLVVRSASYQGERLYVCARGDLTRGRQAVAEAIEGVDRILTRP